MNVDLGEAHYDVTIGNYKLDIFLKELLDKKDDFVIIIDEDIFAHVNKIAPSILSLQENKIIKQPARKESKSVFSLLKIIQKLEDLNFPRSGIIVAIGGGVIGDLAGLASSLWYRGCKLVHVPSTLLSAVDSCVGGKTAINFGSTINALGTYYHPYHIVIDTKILETLPDRELISGMAEVIKYTVIGNENLFKKINIGKLDDLKDSSFLKEIIKLCIQQKADFVRGDIREINKRLYLNLGHTIGHGLEINSVIDGHEKLRHGEGVALGLVAVSAISYKLGKLKEEGLKRIMELIRKYQLPTSISSHKDFPFILNIFIDKCIDATFRDKKRTKTNLRLILPIDYGNKCEIFETSSRELIRFGLNSILKG